MGQFWVQINREYAARAESTTGYAWGNSISCSQARFRNYLECGTEPGTDPVGSYSPNKWGLFDLHGNVSEWTQDCWNDSYYDAPTDGSAREDGICYDRVIRGGSWNYLPDWLRSAKRIHWPSFSGNYYIGFRLVRDVETVRLMSISTGHTVIGRFDSLTEKQKEDFRAIFK